MARTTETEPSDLETMEAELAAMQARVAAAREAQQAEARAQALATTVQLIGTVPTTEQALVHAQAGEISQTIMELGRIITAATDARKAAAEAGRATGVKVTRAGNGTVVRESAIRDDVAQVFADHPGDWFTPSQLVSEIPPAPNGNPRSAGAILGACTTMVAHGDAEESEDRPRRFRGTQGDDAQGDGTEGDGDE